MPIPLLSAALLCLLSPSLFAAEPAPALATAAVEARLLPREYRLDAVVEAVNRTTVSAQTQGQVQEVLVDVDDFVEQGAIVARLKDTEHRARVAQATADLQSASAQLAQAQEAYGRVKGLFARKTVSQSDMDKANADLETARAAQDAAAARLTQAQEQLEYTQIRAPYSGLVTQRHLEVGEMASPGQPVMTGISLDRLRVTADVPQSLIASVRTGGSARVYLADAQAVETRSIVVFPFADPSSNTFKVRAELPPLEDSHRQTLFPGMFVKIGFPVGEQAELTVPTSAVVRRSEVTGVYAVTDDGQVHFRLIRLGRALDGGYTVLAGVSAGERVAIDPIAAGIRLKAQAAERQAASRDKERG